MRSIPAAPPASSPAARAVMQGNRSADTRAEVAVRSALHRAGLRFRKNARPGPGLPRADVVFPRARVVAFIDGCYWHRCPDHGTSPSTNRSYWSAKLDANVARDRRNDAALSAAGWRAVRVWEHEDPERAAEKIEVAYRAGLRGGR